MNNKIIAILITLSISNITMGMITQQQQDGAKLDWRLDKVFSLANPATSAYCDSSATQLLTSTKKGEITAFDTATGNVLFSIAGNPTAVYCYTQFSNLFAFSETDSNVTLYFPFDTNKSPSVWGAFNSDLPIAPHLFDSTQLVARVNHDNVAVYDLLKHYDVAELAHPSRVNDCCFHPSKKILASVTSTPDAAIRMFNVETKKQILQLKYKNYLYSIRFDETGNRLAAANQDTVDVIDIHDVNNPQTIYSLNNGNNSLQACLGGKYLAVKLLTGVINLFNIDEKKHVASYQENEATATMDCFYSNGDFFVTFNGNNVYLYKKTGSDTMDLNTSRKIGINTLMKNLSLTYDSEGRLTSIK